MPAPDQPILRIAGISKRFPGVWALRDVAFDVMPGEVHGLVGENGAGKSTLMAVASGALMPEEGTVSIGGVQVQGDLQGARDLGLAIVRQEPSLMPELSIAENLYLGVPASRRPAVSGLKGWAQAVLGRWDEHFDIDVTQRVEQADSEQRFIVEIAKALANEPRVLVLDEPTEHLLSDNVARLFRRVRSISASGTGVVYISHRIREVRDITSRITVLRDGATRGTFRSGDLSEAEIVRLIVGKTAAHEYPARKGGWRSALPALRVDDCSGRGFDRVILELFPGEIVGLGGMDGNGKREFMRALAGITPAPGTVVVGGRSVRITDPSAANAAGIHYLSGARQAEGIFASLSVGENFSFRSLRDDRSGPFLDAARERERGRDAIGRFEIKTPGLTTPISALSGGNQQKVAMAGVLAARPAVLLVDEPTQGVDVGARGMIYATMAQAVEAGAAVLLISSDAAEVAGLSDRVAIFSRGHIVEWLEGDAVGEAAITQAVLTSGSVRGRRAGGGGRAERLVDWLAGYWAPNIMVAAVIVSLGVCAASINGHYLSPLNLKGICAAGAILVLVACAQQVLLMIGGIDLSIGPLMGLVVVVQSFFLTSGAPWPMQALGWLLTIAVAVAVGLVNWALVDPLGLHPMVATLSTFMAIQAISLILRPVPAGLIDDDLMDGINGTVGFVPLTLVAALIVVAVLEVVLIWTPWGIKLRALGSRPEAARLAGISPRIVRLAAYLSCSLIAAAAAVAMMGQIGVGDAKGGASYTLASIAAAVIGGASLFGGRGSFLGALLGAFLISQVNSVTAFVGLDDTWRAMLLGCLIVAAVAFYSKGRQLAVAP